MFIEQKKSGKFLIKKSFGKKFSTKIDFSEIKKNDIVKITKKECDFIYQSQNYNLFLKNIYNTKLLKDVIFRSKLLSNSIEILSNVKNYLLITSDTEKFSKFIKHWLNHTFPKKYIYNSNNIEGSKIPENELEKIINNKNYTYKIKNEIIEVNNSIKSWDFLKKRFIFNEINIKKLYHILTKNLLQENGEKYPRGFKKISNVVNNNITTSPENVQQEVNNLINWYKCNKKYIFPLQLAFDFHLKYEQIHPFENGNGRTGRFIMNKILLQNNFLPMIVFAENKLSYFNAISSCYDGNRKKYYKFMLEQYDKTLKNVGVEL